MRALASVLPEFVRVVLGFAGLGTLLGTALALLLVARFPNLHDWRFIGFVSVFLAGVGAGLYVLGVLPSSS